MGGFDEMPANLILYFIVYSFGGWILECIYARFVQKKFVNRGFLKGCFCPIYGFGAFISVFSFYLAGILVKQNIYAALLGVLFSMILVTVFEYFSGYLLDKLFNRRYWDYTGHFLNINTYVCLPYSLLWGVLAFVLAKGIHPHVAQLTALIPSTAKAVFSFGLLLYLLIDVFATSLSLLKNYAAENQCSLRAEYRSCVGDLLADKTVLSMDNYIQHSNITCLEHCRHVSYYSFVLCKMLKLDYKAAARAGLLHDYFLYDWHGCEVSWHGFRHPYIALTNADRDFELSARERDIIKKHMWPLTPVPPKYPESLIVTLSDKYCALIEVIHPKAVGNVPYRIKKYLQLIFER